jgi:hypothetical protein
MGKNKPNNVMDRGIHMGRSKRFTWMIILCLFLLHGQMAEANTENHSISKQMQRISYLIDKKYWDAAVDHSRQLKDMYKQQL